MEFLECDWDKNLVKSLLGQILLLLGSKRLAAFHRKQLALSHFNCEAVVDLGEVSEISIQCHVTESQLALLFWVFVIIPDCQDVIPLY